MNEMASPENGSNPETGGLRSISGIRWLLLAGSAVTGVSIFRLVQARWAMIPVPVQFLILVAGALAIFGLGNLTRRRLHLPAAGSALLFLFTGLVPVMAWGAVYLKLLDTPAGWIAFSAGGAALLGAAVSVLRSVLRYPGKLYPAAFGILLAAQAVLPWIGNRWPWSPQLLYGPAAVILGAVLHLGSRHVNRFFFHRDRRDGVDRPIHLVPFLLLGVLYAGALSLLDLRSTFLALPLAVLGMVLAGTGEEYYQALADSLGRAPERWPFRSVALLALGFSLVAIAQPLALMDGTFRCLFLTALCAAALFLRWSLRYGHRAIHVLGVLAAFAAYHCAPALWGGHPKFTTWNDLGFLAFLAGFGFLLARRQASEELRAAHGVLTALVILRTTAAAILLYGPLSPTAALIAQAVFALAWLAARLARSEGRIDPALRRSAQGLAILHAGFAVMLFAHAASILAVTVEPLILILLGIVLLWEGLTGKGDGVELGLSLIVAWAPVQLFFWSGMASWSTALIAGLGLAGLELAALILILRRFGPREDTPQALLTLGVRHVTQVWLALAGAACLLFAGLDVLLLAVLMTGVLFLLRTRIEGWAARIAVPARMSLLPLLHLAVLAAAGGRPERDLPVVILSHPLSLFPWIAGLGLLWRGLLEILGRRRTLRPWSIALAIVTAGGYVVAYLQGADFSLAENLALIATAVGWAAAFAGDGLRDDRAPEDGWAAQAWAGLALLHGFTAGWLHWGSGLAPWIFLGVGAAEYALGALLSRTEIGEALVPSCRRIGLALPAVAGVLSLLRVPAVGTVWAPALVTFLVSLFYTVAASREPRRIFPALASAAFLGLALLKVIAASELGMEVYFLAPGFALLALAWLLRTELGPAWSRHLTAAGACFVYATPIVALSSEISWGWLAALLLCAVGFGAASFSLRSRSLLTVSTAALLTDLGFIVFRIGTTAPTVLWVLGLVFGLALMAVAAWLEHQREGVLQQIRLFGRELRAWS
ncbi:MAG TPA: hypothetical protein VGM86_19420 [Thermoanaerobaculia bacterium]|jgi:hypothetical protein